MGDDTQDARTWLEQDRDARIAQLEEALRGLVEALPRCGHDGLHDPDICEATHHEPFGGWYCDECCDGTDSHELPWAEALRAALRQLAEPKGDRR